MKKSIFIVLIVVIFAVSGVGGYYYQIQQPKPMHYVSETVAVGDIAVEVLATGVVQAIDLVEVGSQTTGQVKALAVELGQTVKKGELIAKIDSTTQQNALQEEQLNFQTLQNQHDIKMLQLEQLQQEFESHQQAYEGKVLARADFLKIKHQLDLAKKEVQGSLLQLKQAQLKIATAKDNLNYTNIKAPIDGTVVAVITQAGQTINASSSSPTIVKLAQMDTVQIKAKFSESDMPKLRVGQSATFYHIGVPNTKRSATLDVLEMSPMSESGAVYYAGLLTVPNLDRQLLMGMTVNVVVATNHKQGVPLVPKLALGESLGDNRYEVLVLTTDDKGNQTTSTKTVQIGLSNATHSEVVSGLVAGERVVVSSSDGEVDTLDGAF